MDAGGIQGIAEGFQCHGECVADAVLHQNIVFVLGIPQHGPGIDGLLHHLCVVKDSDSSPAVGDGVLIVRIELAGFFVVDLSDVLCVGNVVKIQRLEQIVLDHFLDHVIGRAYQIVGDGAGLDFRIHDLIGFKFFIDDLNACFFLKHVKDFRVNIFAPVVDDHLFCAGSQIRSAVINAAAGDDNDHQHRQHAAHNDLRDTAERAFLF